MPKMKSHRGAKKRFGLTGKGKVKRNRAYASHILTKKNATRKRRLRQGSTASKADVKRIKKMILS